MRAPTMLAAALLSAALAAPAVHAASANASVAGETAGAAAKYNPTEAIEFAYLAASAFCHGIAQDWDCGPCQKVPGVQGVRTADDDDLSAHSYVAKYRGQCVVAFRGTDATVAWMQDLKSLQLVAMPGCTYEGKTCQVGQGFWEDYTSLKSKVQQDLESSGCTKDSPVAFTGHSLGAALATLAAFDLAGAGYTVSKLYTFGSPRVGDAVWAEAFGRRLGAALVFRVTKSDDPVPMLPPQQPFEHVGEEVYYQGYTFRTCVGNEDQSCSDSQADQLFVNVIKCAWRVVCGHMTYFPGELPFETRCHAGGSGSFLVFP